MRVWLNFTIMFSGGSFLISLLIGLNLATFLALGATLFYFLVLKRKHVTHLSEENLKLIETEEKAARIIDEATFQAKEIVGTAEIQESGLVAQLRVEMRRLIETHQKELEAVFGRVGREIEEKIGTSEKIYADFVLNLKNRTDLTETNYEELTSSLNDKVNSLRNATIELEKNYREEMAGILERIKGNVEKRIEEAQNSYGDYQRELESRLSGDLELKQNKLEEKIDGFFAETQILLQGFTENLQSRTETQLDQEIGNAKKIIEEYRRQRMEIIDENIVSILEKTLNVALGKKLTLAEQTELVYEALEQAKTENVFK